MAFKKPTIEIAGDEARKAIEAGLNVLVLRFNEKLTDISLSGSPVKAVNSGIAAVEAEGWQFIGLAVENDTRTLGDRMAFYCTFRRNES